MKITKKILENIIKEEIASILQEQDQAADAKKVIADLKAKIEAEKDPKKKAKLKAKLKAIEKEDYINNLANDLGIKTKTKK